MKFIHTISEEMFSDLKKACEICMDSPEFLYGSIEIIPLDEWMEGKEDPTEWSESTKTIRIRSDYDFKEDRQGWLMHEIAHAFLNYLNAQDDGKEYPFNSTEVVAYTAQLMHLYERDLISTYEDARNLLLSKEERFQFLHTLITD